jgi:hypothetical protein
MAKSPGLDPLGHKPFSKVKLEGPKVHHENHGSNASVPGKGNGKVVRGEHWEKQYNPQQSRARPESKFDPIQGKDRPTMYNKVNETDH